MNQTQLAYSQTALEATIAIHNSIKDDEFFAGYNGDIDAFNTLHAEVYAIVRYELFDGAEVDQVVETFYLYQTEIENGEREVDWYSYL